MITISILGLDQFVVGRYSKEHTANLAELFECDEDSINFFAPNAMVFHNGVEQTSWETQVRVYAPSKYDALEDKVAGYILKTLSDFSINVEINFQYFDEDSHYERINADYPRYIREDNIVNTDTEDLDDEDEDDEEEEELHEHVHAEPDINNPDEIYLGDAFEGFEEKLAKAQGTSNDKNKKG